MRRCLVVAACGLLAAASFFVAAPPSGAIRKIRPRIKSLFVQPSNVLSDGGSVTVRAVVLHGRICVLSAGDSIPSQRFSCPHDAQIRTLHVPANQSGAAQSITVRLVAIGRFGSTAKVTAFDQTWAAAATVTDGVGDPSLLADALAFSLDGLPPLPNVYALPGDSVDLISNVSEPAPQSTNGVVAFSVDGQQLSGCTSVSVFLNGSVYQAFCQYAFANSGTYDVVANYVGADGSLGTASLYVSVATPDQVATIDAECAEAATMTFHC